MLRKVELDIFFFVFVSMLRIVEMKAINQQNFNATHVDDVYFYWCIIHYATH